MLQLTSYNALLRLTLISLFISYSLGAPAKTNITIEVPDGTTNHGDPHLLCTPTRWTDIVMFYVGNFLAHAATVKSYPGEPTAYTIANLVATVFFPTIGVIRGLNSIVRCPLFRAKSPLQRAAWSGALCMVARSPDWKPMTGDTVRLRASRKPRGRDAQASAKEPDDIPLTSPQIPAVLSTYIPPGLTDASSSRYWSYQDTIQFFIRNREVYGSNRLPEGYKFAFVPRNTTILKPKSSISPEIPSSYSMIRAVVALIQLLYASFTLYRARGDQIRRYGYASFGLTVAPYAVMSALNLIGSLVAPDYSTLYLVESEVMDEAKRREGAQFNYVVGRIVPVAESDTSDVTIEENWVHFSGSFEVTDDRERILLHPKESSVVSSLGGEQRDSESLEITLVPPNEPATKYRSVLVPACLRFQGADDGKVTEAFHPRLLDSLAVLTVGAITIAIIGGLSGFQKGESTLAQRVWTMVWLVFGIYIPLSAVFGPAFFGPASFRPTVFRPAASRPASEKFLMPGFNFFFFIFYCAPSIGGFVVVGQMLHEYGICTRFD